MTDSRLTMVLVGGRVVTPDGVVVADVEISGEQIVGLTSPSSARMYEDVEVIDVTGMHILPGAIDTHIHLREPGYTHKEDIESGTRAAAAGGYTTVVGMPNVNPPTNTLDRFREVVALYEKSSLVDFNHNPSPTVLDEVDSLAEAGALGFKVYMIEDSGRDYPHMPGVGVHDHGHLLQIAEAVAATGKPLMVHPHDQQLMSVIEERFWARGERNHVAYAQAFASYEGMVWDSATSFLIRLQEATGVRMHILHCKTPRMVELIRRAKQEGIDVTAEMNPVAVFLCNEWENIVKLGPYALSTWTGEGATDVLWEAVRDGTIDVIGSDHAPHTREEKEIGWVDMWKAPGGVPQIQDVLSLFLSSVNAGELSLQQLAEITATRPAEIFGLYPRKGAVIVGADADLVVVDLQAQRTIDEKRALTKSGWSPWNGQRVTGVPVHTIVRGRFVMRDERVVGEPGWGKLATG